MNILLILLLVLYDNWHIQECIFLLHLT
jgi:hypothetical protein